MLEKTGKPLTLQYLYKFRYLYAMAAPALILVFVFNYLPLFGWIIAFKNYRAGKNLFDSEWIGLQQFKAFLYQSSDYGYLLRNTLVMNISMLILNLFVAVAFAILLNELRNKFFAKTIQTISFFPFFISWIIIYSLVNGFLGVSTGAFNLSLVHWGIIPEGLNILGDPKYSWALIVLIALWKSLGYNAIIFIAAISSISPEEYEAADIDGASRWQKIRHVTIPNLMSTLIVLLIMNSGWILNSNFDLYYLFTNATNWTRMEVLDIYIYKYGLQLGNYPYATAVGIMKTVVALALLLLVNTISKRVNNRGIL